jgi:hypothetical protein
MVSSRKPSLQTSKPRCSPVSGLIFVRDSPTANLPAAIRDQPCPLPQGGDPTGPRRLAASPVRAISSLHASQAVHQSALVIDEYREAILPDI